MKYIKMYLYKMRKINYIKRKFIILATVAFIITILASCTYKNDSENDFFKNSMSAARNNSQSIKYTDDVININILGKNILSINTNRMNDDVYRTGFLDNRWSLNEIDAILSALRGSWQVDDYVGFVAAPIYNGYLFDHNDSRIEDIRDELFKSYDEKVNDAKNNIPKLYFSIKERIVYSYTNERSNEGTQNNYIYVYGLDASPISIILSQDRSGEAYPVFSDQTTISADFIVEYPVLYIKFFIKNYKDNEDNEILKYESRAASYQPATLVISSDNKFYILIDGAFYSLKEY